MAIAFNATMLTTCSSTNFNCNGLNLLGLSLLSTLNLYIPPFFLVCKLLFKNIDPCIQFRLSLFMFITLFLKLDSLLNVFLYLLQQVGDLPFKIFYLFFQALIFFDLKFMSLFLLDKLHGLLLELVQQYIVRCLFLRKLRLKELFVPGH